MIHPDTGTHLTDTGILVVEASTDPDEESVYAASLNDSNGIQSVESATLESRVGSRTRELAPTRRDANTFSIPAVMLRHRRWRNVTFEVAYSDGAGTAKTISGYYTL